MSLEVTKDFVGMIKNFGVVEICWIVWCGFLI